MKTRNPELLEELTNIFLALCWNLEKNPQSITGIPGDKTRFCFRPFHHSIGFEENPENPKKAKPCQMSILVYVLRFLSGHISLSNKNINSKEIRNLFFQGISSELIDLFQCPSLGIDIPFGSKRVTSLDKISDISLVVANFLEFSKDYSKPLSLFKECRTSQKEKLVILSNPMLVSRIIRYSNTRRDWVIAVAQKIHQGDHALRSFNINLGLGLRALPYVSLIK